MWEGGYVSWGLWDRDDVKMPIVNINLQYYNTDIFKQLSVDEQSNSCFISLARHFFNQSLHLKIIKFYLIQCNMSGSDDIVLTHVGSKSRPAGLE